MTTASANAFRAPIFVPANRLDRVAKAFGAGADAVIIDLEDGIGPDDRRAARTALARFMTERPPGPLVVRINNMATPDGPPDLAMIGDLARAALAVMLPKAQSRTEIDILAAHLFPGQTIVPLIESARGLRAAADIGTHPAVAALAFGGADFSADLGAALTWEPMLVARATLVAAAAEGGVACWDVPSLALGDAPALAQETRRVRDMGFTAKMAIHPAQIETINDVFTPTADAIDLAGRVIAAFDAAGGGATRLDGRMIDLPVVRAARRTLARSKHLKKGKA